MRFGGTPNRAEKLTKTIPAAAPAAGGGGSASPFAAGTLLTDESQIEFDPIDGHDHDGVTSHTVDHANLANVTANQHHAKLHQADHQFGGADELIGNLTATARLNIAKNGAATTGTRRKLNLIEGTNITITLADDAAGEKVDATIAAAAGARQMTWTPYAGAPAGDTWTNQPLAATELFGATAHRATLDLTSFTQVRMWANILTAGATNAVLQLEYSTNSGGSWTSAGSIGPVSVQINATGLRTVAFANLAAGAKADVWLRIAGSGGDGVADPVIAHIGVEFK